MQDERRPEGRLTGDLSTSLRSPDSAGDTRVAGPPTASRRVQKSFNVEALHHA